MLQTSIKNFVKINKVKIVKLKMPSASLRRLQQL